MLQILRYSRVYETNNVIGNLAIINNRFKIYGISIDDAIAAFCFITSRPDNYHELIRADVLKWQNWIIELTKRLFRVCDRLINKYSQKKSLSK